MIFLRGQLQGKKFHILIVVAKKLSSFHLWQEYTCRIVRDTLKGLLGRGMGQCVIECNNNQKAKIKHSLRTDVGVPAMETALLKDDIEIDNNYSGGTKSDFYGEDPDDIDNEVTTDTQPPPKNVKLRSIPRTIRNKQSDAGSAEEEETDEAGETTEGSADSSEETAEVSEESSEDYETANTNECDQSSAPKSCFIESLPSARSLTSTEESNDVKRRTCSTIKPCPK